LGPRDNFLDDGRLSEGKDFDQKNNSWFGRVKLF